MALLDELTVEDMNKLRHMLGICEKFSKGYRNYFVTSHEDPSMARLLAHGLVVKNTRYKLSEDACFHATLKGAQFVGLERLPR